MGSLVYEVKIEGLVFFVVFVVTGCIVYVLAIVVSFIVVFWYCVCALFVCNVCYFSVVLLYYCYELNPNRTLTNIYMRRGG
jgi:hypothetical protein